MRRGSIRDDAAQGSAVSRDESVERVDYRISPQCSQGPAEPVGKPQFFEEFYAAPGVSRDRRTVCTHEPPAVSSCLLRDSCQQPDSRVVAKRQQGQCLTSIDPRDDTRRKSAEPSGA